MNTCCVQMIFYQQLSSLIIFVGFIKNVTHLEIITSGKNDKNISFFNIRQFIFQYSLLGIAQRGDSLAQIRSKLDFYQFLSLFYLSLRGQQSFFDNVEYLQIQGFDLYDL